jgi:hypothetical protein
MARHFSKKMNGKIEKLKKPRLYPAPKGTGLTRLIDKL